MTPIEVLAEMLKGSFDEGDGVVEILVPEQCMMVQIGEKVFHVTVEEI